jgi:glycosyltransferase involved in cell wall biosynthesis
MRILYINHYAGSLYHGMEYRPYFLSREWVGAGHAVRIVASDKSHIRIQQPRLNGEKKRVEIIDGIQYTWLKTHPYTGNGVKRAINMCSFVHGLYRHAKILSEEFRPEAVIASSTYPMDIWPAHRIAKACNAKLVFEIHDLWPLTPIELGGMSRLHPFIVLLQAAESYAYRHADSVVSILPKVHEYVAGKGLTSAKLHIIPNGADPGGRPTTIPHLALEVKNRLADIARAGHAIVGYAGNHGISNSLDTLVQTAQIMRNEQVSFVLVGDGPEKNELRRYARAKQLPNVYFIDPIPKEQIPALLQMFDIAFIGWRRHPLYRFGIAPNKLIDYMMAARPILHAVDAGNDLVAEADCGLTIAPESPEVTASGIRALLNLNDSARWEMGNRGREYVLKNLTYPILSERFLAACR